jgi:hypothetical protein
MQGSSITQNFQLISFAMLSGGKADTTKLQSCIVGRFRIYTCLVFVGAPEGLLSSSTKCQWKPHPTRQVSPCHPRGIQSMPPDVPLAVDAALLLPVCDFKS